jgi:hypothetical protein
MDALVSWFVLQVDEDLSLTSQPGKDSCWEQAVFSLARPIDLETNQKIVAQVSTFQGMVQVEVEQNQSDFKVILYNFAVIVNKIQIIAACT